MTIRYLLDTNIVSHLIRPESHTAQSHLISIKPDRFAISAVTEAELLFGLARKPEAVRLANSVREFLLDATIFPWDSKAALEYGNLRAALERSGQAIGNMDMMIAAHALAESLILVTNDAAFQRIPGLKTEDWTRA